MEFLSGYEKQPHDMNWFHSREWLSNIEIDHILHFVSRKKQNFFHAGTYAQDFQSIIQGKCNSDKCNLENLPGHAEGVNYISFVLNTDKTSGPGVHWFCVFIDLSRNDIYVYDPASIDRNYNSKNVNRLVTNLNSHYNTKFTVSNNLIQKQPLNSGECGIYVVYFILKMIEFSELYPLHSECNAEITKKMWKNKAHDWDCIERQDSEYFPWYNPIEVSLHQRKKHNTIFCGKPFDIFSTRTCFPDINKLNEYMANYIRKTLFCINENGTCILPNEDLEYNECSFMDMKSPTPNKTKHGGKPGRFHKFQSIFT
tara:strand:+ start:1410 stop:2345 length:936 start_codon:yes stop_codon:yes gene_type:complete